MKSQKRPAISLRFFKTSLIFAFLFFLPTQLGKHFFVGFAYVNGVKVDYLAPTLYATDVFSLLLLILFWPVLAAKIRRRLFLTAAVFLLLILRAVGATHPFLAFYQTLKWLQFYSLFLIAEELTANNKMVLGALMTSGLVQLVITLLQLARQASLQGAAYFLGERYLTMSHPEVAKATLFGEQFLRPYGTFSHPNSLAGFYLLLYFYVLTQAAWRRLLLTKAAALLVFTALIFISFSKAAIVTYLILNLVYFLPTLKSCRLCLTAKAVVTSVIALIFLSAKTDPHSLAKRLRLFYDSLTILKDRFWQGTGLGHYLIYQARLGSQSGYFFLQPVHNVGLLFFAQTGAVIGTLLAYLIVKKLSAFCRRPEALLCLTAVVATGMVDHYWLTLQQNWLIAAVVFGQLAYVPVHNAHLTRRNRVVYN